MEWVVPKVYRANMSVSAENSRFFRKSVRFLRFMVTSNGVTTDPEKDSAY